MLRGDAARVTPDAWLQRHPDLVRAMADPCAVFPAGRPSESLRLSAEALEVLDRFSRPRKVRAVLPDADEEVLAALDEWVARGLLVPTRRAIPRSKWTPLEARLWTR